MVHCDNIFLITTMHTPHSPLNTGKTMIELWGGHTCMSKNSTKFIMLEEACLWLFDHGKSSLFCISSSCSLPVLIITRHNGQRA